ncbi:Putative major facilitator superfamily, MFS transporter superfamily [Septoria linicola]|uniref:Major facilitator superfamily, MFS transporter superfamily n=1 Tax=Septoria linicola TaxID=215465 RepID=A0A9Q9EPI1_9PEZI|nr:Putative major facilitator superfamily, MFS transporter superfamily [Septoria linicola]
MACGFSPNFASLLVFRFIGGLCGSPGLTLASSTIADLFEPGRARGVALFCYYSMPWLGSVLGPLIGFLVVAEKTWEWTQWVFLFIAVPIALPGLALLRESKQSILDKRASRARQMSMDERKDSRGLLSRIRDSLATVPQYVQSSLLRPLSMLFTELIVGLVCLYAGFNFGLIYALVIVFPDIFAAAYSFNEVQQGLAFLGLIVGCILGPALLIADGELIERKKRGRVDHEKQSSTDKLSPEVRLHGAMIGAVLLPTGLIIFAWTARPGISFLVPIFASTLITLGALTIYVSTSAYVVDVYGPRYGASANAASSISRYTLAAAIPLFILQMYDGLGVGWATSVLALCAVIMLPIPFCFYRWGPQIRSRCKYQTE